MTETTIGTVGAIRRFPVKSMGGESLTETHLDASGIPGDRRLALRDLESGKILSAKAPRVGTALLECTATTTGDDVLVTAGGTTVLASDRAAAERHLTEHLGRPVAIEHSVAEDDQYESYWPEVDGVLLSDVSIDLPVAMSTAKASFVDLAALHLLATASLDHLGALLPDAAIAVDRFRPSIVVDTGTMDAGFVENGWTQRNARIGGAGIRLTDATPRCVMTTLAQRELPRDRAILQGLAAHNRIETPGLGHFACLGIYAEVTAPGPVRVGDPVVLLDE